MLKFKTLTTLVLGMASLTAMQASFAALPGAYIGGQIGQGNTHYDDHYPTRVHDKVLAGRIFGGYQAHENVAAEIGFSHFGNTEFRHINGNGHGSIDEHAYDIVAKATLPVGVYKNADLYVKGGVAYIRALKNGLLPGSSSVGKVTPTFGVGIAANNKVPAFIEWSRIQGRGFIKNADLISLGLAMKLDKPAEQTTTVTTRTESVEEASLVDDMKGTGVEVTQQGNETKLTLPSKISFDYNKATIKPGFYGALDKIVTHLKANPNTPIRLVGHTDNIGSQNFNQKLSEKRAVSVKNYLTSHDIDAANIQIKGRGKLDPIASNKTAEGRAKNRRVEMFIKQTD